MSEGSEHRSLLSNAESEDIKADSENFSRVKRGMSQILGAACKINTENVNADSENIIADSENIIANSENIIANSENIIADSENIIVDSENIMADSKNIIADSENIIAYSENIIADSENIIADSKNIIADSGNIIADSENIITDSENIIADSENIIADSENIIADSENIIADSENVNDDSENVNADVNADFENATHTCPECEAPVSEQDCAEISRNIPQRLWTHILMECLQIEDDALYRARYNSGNWWIESVILQALLDWKKRECPTKAQLDQSFIQAVNKGICKDNKWFEFLLKEDCQQHFPVSDVIEEWSADDTLGTAERCLIRLLHSSIYVHVMLTCFTIKIFHGSSPYVCGGYSELEDLMSNIIGIIFVILIIFGYLQHFISRNTREWLLPENVPKVNLLVFILQFLSSVSVIAFQTSKVWYFATASYICTFYIPQIIIAVCVSLSGKASRFWFVTEKKFDIVYGKYKPNAGWPEVLLPYFTWSFLGILLAYFILNTWSPSEGAKYQITCLTQVVLLTAWFLTLKRECIYNKEDLKMLGKSFIWAFVVFLLVPLCCGAALLIYRTESIVVSDNDFDYVTCSALPSEYLNIMRLCLATLVILNIQRIFCLLPEESRKSRREVLFFLAMLIANTIVGGYIKAGAFTNRIPSVAAIGFSILAPFQPLSACYFCWVRIEHNSTGYVTMAIDHKIYPSNISCSV